MVFGACREVFESGWAQASGEGSSIVFHARTLRKPLDIYAHRAACAAPLSFADYKEMQLHQCPDLTVLGLGPQNIRCTRCNREKHESYYRRAIAIDRH
jgi:hypothetical protein